ncbi:MAG: PLP-dependent aspartate aminotransferase family protein [Acidobacteriota bacterium]|nr:PLP-dependent aspartate aminotransferase family protein [Acidobacteriota bacterium]
MSQDAEHKDSAHLPRNSGIETRAIHAGQAPDPVYGAVAPPIYQTSTFAFSSPEQGARRFAGEEEGYIYSRLANPTTKMLEDCVASLEGGHGGIAVASGMGAVSTIFLGLLGRGDHVVMTDTVYGPSRLLLEHDLARFGVEATFADTSETENLARAMRPHTRLVFIETPTNPTLRLSDLAACAEACHRAGALMVVDNTFASPVLQRPIALGADIVMHSTTKYINGHGDVVGGVIVTRTPELHEKLLHARIYFGASMDPHQSWLVLRGLKTLPLRVRAAQDSAQRLARLLEDHPAVSRVIYPGLASHPQRVLASRQMEGPGSMIAFELTGGYEAGKALMTRVRLATLAVSLGGVETLIEHPASMTHAGLSEAELEATGISPALVRLAVGCESTADLEHDLGQALDAL